MLVGDLLAALQVGAASFGQIDLFNETDHAVGRLLTANVAVGTDPGIVGWTLPHARLAVQVPLFFFFFFVPPVGATGAGGQVY